MKKVNLLFTKVLLAVAMTIMVFGVNKQTVKAVIVSVDENGLAIDDGTNDDSEVNEDGYTDGYSAEDHIKEYKEETTATGYTKWDSDKHKFVYDEELSSDGYEYTIRRYWDNGYYNYTEEIIKSDLIAYAPKTIKLSKTTYYYTGKTIKPSVTVYDRKGNVIDNSNYTITYENNVKVSGGTYEKALVKVQFNGERYSGELQTTFTIKATKAKKATITSLKAWGKGFTITFKDTDKTVAGYQIQYSKTKDFKNAKSFYVPSSATKTGKVGLKGNTKYYVRIRAYREVPQTTTSINYATGTTMTVEDDELISVAKGYSEWSTVKSVKTKSKASSKPILYIILFDNSDNPFYYTKLSDSQLSGKGKEMVELRYSYMINGQCNAGNSRHNKYRVYFRLNDGVVREPEHWGITVY